jgi:hypothetical protein
VLVGLGGVVGVVLGWLTLTRKMLFDNGAGVIEHDLKELTRAYIAHTIECGY